MFLGGTPTKFAKIRVLPQFSWNYWYLCASDIYVLFLPSFSLNATTVVFFVNRSKFCLCKFGGGGWFLVWVKPKTFLLWLPVWCSTFMDDTKSVVCLYSVTWWFALSHVCDMTFQYGSTIKGHRLPLIFQYIYHTKFDTLRPYLKFQNHPPIQSIILFGQYDQVSLLKKYVCRFFTKLKLGPFLRGMLLSDNCKTTGTW